MDARIKKLRKALGLTQQEFADKLGIKRNTIAKYETGRGEPTNAVIALIRREFNVSEAWLRTGDGEMFIKLSRDEELSAFFGGILTDGKDDFRRRLVSALSKMTPEQWDLLESMAVNLMEEMKEGQKKTDP